MKIRPTYNTVDQAHDAVMESYRAGFTYHDGELNGVPFTIRMNKDHGMNKRNNDMFGHVLSLVNGDCEGMYYENGLGTLIVQKRVADIDDVEFELEIFLKDIISYGE